MPTHEDYPWLRDAVARGRRRRARRLRLPRLETTPAERRWATRVVLGVFVVVLWTHGYHVLWFTW
jgi:hypothetical protein